jgi:hypothetical protein
MLNEDLRRWFREKWVDISKKTKGGKHPPCGREKAKDSKYPKCRPSVRVSSETPETSGEMTKAEKKKAVTQKRRAESKVSTEGKGRKPVMTSHKKINEETLNKITNFVLKQSIPMVNNRFEFNFNKTILENIDSSFLNKKVIIQYLNEENAPVFQKGIFKIASNVKIKEGKDFEILTNSESIGVNYEDILSLKTINDKHIIQYDILNEGKNKPTNAKLWSKAKSLAKQKFKVYPSAYANGWAAKWYKKHGGGWKTVNEEVQNNIEINEETKKIVSKLVSNLLPSLNEEIVNAKHAGTMTKKEIKSRDKIAKKIKAKPIKGKDTEENAKYRLATYIELRKRGQEPKPKKKKTKKKKGKP